jgi:hypothetical protein
VASRVRVAASTCLVVSGLFIGGAGGAMALADPGNGYGKSDDHQGDDSLVDVIRHVFGMETGNDQHGDSESRRWPHTRWGNGRDDEETGQSPTKTPPSESTTKTPTTAVGQTPPPPPQFNGGGGGGGATEPLPRFKQPSVPDMQLPDELQPGPPVPGGPAVLDAGAGAVAVAPVGPAAPIALPVIVVPPVGLGSGAGGGAGGPGSPGAPPGLPRALSAEPPAGRVPPPVNVGGNAAVPASSYRVGYTEYLRSAGLPQVAALAVPGLAGILVLTGAGGLVGYRQAKAGHAVRAGTVRFMR